MFEVKISISAPELVQAINNLAAALTGVNPQPQQSAPQPQQEPCCAPTGAVNPAAPANPVPAPTAAPSCAYPSNPPAAYPGQAPMPQQGYAPAGAMNPANPAPAGGPAAAAQMAGPASAYPSNPSAAYPGQAPMVQQPAAPQSGVPLAQPPQYTTDQIMKAGGALMDAGRVDDLMNLLHSFGVAAVTELKPEQLGAFATALRSLGAKI